MAHATDYQSTLDISRLRKSPSGMNPTLPARIKLSKSKSSDCNIVSLTEHRAYILISNFIRENPTWAIESAYNYCLKYYSDFGATKEIFAKALHDYIISKD